VCIRDDHGHGRCNGLPDPRTWGGAGAALVVVGVAVMAVDVRRRRRS
jgi:hypothetical protein